jgi:hypothetical protein
MPWTEKEDTALLLRVLDLNITVDPEVFEAAATSMGLSFNTVR